MVPGHSHDTVLVPGLPCDNVLVPGQLYDTVLIFPGLLRDDLIIILSLAAGPRPVARVNIYVIDVPMICKKGIISYRSVQFNS